MTVKEIMEALVADRDPILLCIIIIMTCVQISPLKLNPWDAIFNWFGNRLNKEVIEKIDVIEERLDSHIKDSEKNELKLRRTNILDFSSSVIRGVNYHREKFEFMIAECDSYEKYCADNNIKNGVADASIAEIRRVYKERLHTGTFLTETVSSTGGNGYDEEAH